VNGTVLIVDDQAERLLTLSAILDRNGYHTLTAMRGEDALKLLEIARVDLVVLDFYMPSMDGSEVARQMRRSHPDIPIVIFSGALTLPDRVVAMIDGFVSSGEEPEVLLRTIAGLLPVQALKSRAS
jgi:CheY-like chemotaxis protein